MAHAVDSYLGEWTAADLVQRFGAIPLHRVRHHPPPGKATEADVIELSEYFNAGTRLVWFVYHTPRKELWVYTSPQHATVVAENATLDGGDVLPGFRLDLAELFAEPESQG